MLTIHDDTLTVRDDESEGSEGITGEANVKFLFMSDSGCGQNWASGHPGNFTVPSVKY